MILLLEQLCVFAHDDVQIYRRTGKGLEGLYPKATSILGELMLVLTHAAPALEAGGILVELT